MDRRNYLLSNLAACKTIAELRRSAFYAECAAELDALLGTPEIIASSSARPRIRSFLRIAQWNIEKGKQLVPILDVLQNETALSLADVILLNEADHGMARSGNVHVARKIAEQLKMHMAFAPAHFELTLGTGDDLLAAGENRQGLQGNAILSSYPILEARISRLPVCFEAYEFHEKRYGCRNCLWARLSVHGNSLWVGAAHLEVRETPQCRARQIRHLLAEAPADPADPCLLGGDLNASGFRRGTWWRTLSSVARLLAGRPESVKQRLLRPERGAEPLFMLARRSGFSWDGLNACQATASAQIDGFEDAALMPQWMTSWLHRRLAAFGGYLELRLDWLLGRNVEPLGSAEIREIGSGQPSRGPGRVETIRKGAQRLSDHSPIIADIRMPGRSP